MRLIQKIKEYQSIRWYKRGIRKGYLRWQGWYMSVNPPLIVTQYYPPKIRVIMNILQKIKWMFWNELFLAGWHR